jgi:site-specific recombinase XerD
MASIRMILNKGLKTNDPNKQYPIYVRVLLSGRMDFSCSMGFKVFPHQWDKDKEEVKKLKEIPNYHVINRFLQKVKGHLQDFIYQKRGEGVTPTRAELRHEIKSLMPNAKRAVSVEMDFDENIKEFIEYSKTRKNKGSNKRISKGTIQSYRVSKAFFEAFSKDEYKITFDNVNEKLYEDLQTYCEAKGCTPNTFGKHITKIKTFMAYAVKKKRTDNMDFKSFHVPTDDTFETYLSKDEIKKVKELDLSGFPKHDEVRDWFVIGSWTGLRYGDLSSLSKENLIIHEGVECLRVWTSKTSATVVIPLHKMVKEVLTKRGGEFPTPVYPQKFNYLIKEVCEWAGIDETIHFKKIIGGEEVDVRKQKFEMVKSHTCRRNFCTNAYTSKVPIPSIMAISGHKSISNFLRYIKVTPEEHAKRMSEHVFFTGDLG